MKKYIIIALLIGLVANLNAQQMILSEHIKIGSQVPDVNIHLLEGDQTKVVNIADYRGKIIVLEFWATFCGPCIPALEHFANLKRRNSSAMEVFAITKESIGVVNEFLEKRPTSVNIGIDLYNDLNTFFYHQFMPHTVIIDQKGKIVAITSPEEVTDETIRLLKNGNDINLRLKSEFSELNPNTINENRENPYENSIYKVALMPRRFDSQMRASKPSNHEYKLINCTIPEMYSFFKSEAKGTDMESECVRMARGFEQYELIENSYCLDIIIPSFFSVDMPSYGLKQIEHLFQLNSTYEFNEEKIKGLVLKGNSIAEMQNGSYITIGSLCKLLKKYDYIDFELANKTGLEDTFKIKVLMPKNKEEVFGVLDALGFQINEFVEQKNCIVLSKGF